MKLALGLDVQNNAKGGKLMSIEDSRQGALAWRCSGSPATSRTTGPRGSECALRNTDLELWTEEVEQGVIDNMIIFQKPFRALPLLTRPATARCKGRALVEARRVWLMGRQWGVLFEARRLMLEPLEAPCCELCNILFPNMSHGLGGAFHMTKPSALEGIILRETAMRSKR